MAPINEFIFNISKRASRVPENVNKLVQKIALAIDQAVTLATPVDTGRARSNWLVSIGSPSTSQIEPYSPWPVHSKGGGQERNEQSNLKAAQAQALSVIGTRQPEETIYISNNVDYIHVLNDPPQHSLQAAPFWVQKAVADAQTELQLTGILE